MIFKYLTGENDTCGKGETLFSSRDIRVIYINNVCLNQICAKMTYLPK